MNCCCCDYCSTPANDSASASSAGVFNTVMSDTVGVLWRAASGTVDPWTKAELQSNETASLIQAGSHPCCALQQSECDISSTLATTPGGSSCPKDFMSGLKASLKSATCLTNNAGKTILFIGIGAFLLLIVFNKILSE